MNFANKALVGMIAVAALAGCSKSETTMLTPKAVVPVVDHIEKPKDLQYFAPKVDILFVIDSSGSMGSVQKELRDNAFKFADALSKVAILDYHVGVITTDMDSCSSHCGQLIGYPNFVERNTPNMVHSLSERMVVGTSGSVEEMMFSPVMNALDRYDNSTNKDFLRPDAFLAVIIITDAAEQSRVSPQEFMSFLAQKKGDSKRVLAYGVIRKLAEERSCTTGGENIDGKLESFLGMVVNSNIRQDNVLSLCSKDYGTKLAEFAKDIVSRSAGSVKLTALPDPATITVTYGTQVIPNDLKKGWTYRPSVNSLEFGSEIVWSEQPDGTQLSINFEIIDTE